LETQRKNSPSPLAYANETTFMIMHLNSGRPIGRAEAGQGRKKKRKKVLLMEEHLTTMVIHLSNRTPRSKVHAFEVSEVFARANA
jgi:hypothetical protein